MKALENRSIFSGSQYDREKLLQIHRERLRSMRNVIDTRREGITSAQSARCSSPSKKLMTKQANHDRIVKDNLLLAHKIFNIMEGNSDITEKINDNRHIDNHPGTMNFKARLVEAKRVHERNMLLASRLDTVQPYYKIADLRVVRPVKKRINTTSKAAKRSKFARELNMVLKADRNVDGFGELTHRSAGHGENYGHTRLPSIDPEMQSQSARKADYGDNESRGDSQRGRPNNVLLEYTKIQEGRVLDVAVLKEPFRDRYAIFGIDVDDGQRYELRLTSDEVSSILDGDMLVTSVDNVEVWMALLNKVTLQKVGFFARLPFSSEEVDGINNNNSESRGGSPSNRAQSSRRVEDDIAAKYALNYNNTEESTPPASAAPSNAKRVPTAPTASRPSTERPASRTNTSGNSAAGAIRARQLKSANGSSGSASNGRPTASKPSVLSDGPVYKIDPILSLFADAELAGEFARAEIATPGFLDNATSAQVTLVEVNDDFPDAPPESGSYKNDEAQSLEASAAGVDGAQKPKGGKKSTSSKQRASLKSAGNGGTRSNALRTAAVRRRSIENDQAANGKPVAVASSGPASDPASTALHTRGAKAPAVIAESKGPSGRPNVHKHAPAAVKATGKDATASAQPRVPKPPAGTKPAPVASTESAADRPVSVNISTVAAPEAPRPKSGNGLLSPKAPSSASGGSRPGSKSVTRPVPQSTVSAKVAAIRAQSPQPTRSNPGPATTAQKQVIEETKKMATSCVSSALDLAVASVVRSMSNLSVSPSVQGIRAAESGAEAVSEKPSHAETPEDAAVAARAEQVEEETKPFVEEEAPQEDIIEASQVVDGPTDATEESVGAALESSISRTELSAVLKEPSQVTKSMNASEVGASNDYSTDFEQASSS